MGDYIESNEIDTYKPLFSFKEVKEIYQSTRLIYNNKQFLIREEVI